MRGKNKLGETEAILPLVRARRFLAPKKKNSLPLFFSPSSSRALPLLVFGLTFDIFRKVNPFLKFKTTGDYNHGYRKEGGRS